MPRIIAGALQPERGLRFNAGRDISRRRSSDVRVPNSNYRPDIDGLRAIAISLVVVFHVQEDLIPGGFVGVDVFFAISGFLITGIISDALERGTFSLVGFYERRIRRIFPALIVVLAAVWILGWYTLLPEDFAELGRQIVAGAAFASNLLTYSEVGYFDAAAASKPLLHLWSLGVRRAVLSGDAVIADDRNEAAKLGSLGSCSRGCAVVCGQYHPGSLQPARGVLSALYTRLGIIGRRVSRVCRQSLALVDYEASARSRIRCRYRIDSSRSLPFTRCRLSGLVGRSSSAWVHSDYRRRTGYAGQQSPIMPSRRGARAHQLPALLMALAASGSAPRSEFERALDCRSFRRSGCRNVPADRAPLKVVSAAARSGHKFCRHGGCCVARGRSSADRWFAEPIQPANSFVVPSSAAAALWPQRLREREPGWPQNSNLG